MQLIIDTIFDVAQLKETAAAVSHCAEEECLSACRADLLMTCKDTSEMCPRNIANNLF